MSAGERPRGTAGSRLGLTLLLLLGVSALALPGPAAASEAAAVKARGRLVVLASPHPDSSFIREQAPGQFEGFDYEVMKTFARSLDAELTIKKVESFGGLIPALLAGQGDVIASSFSITAARKRQVDFSSEYFPVVVMVVAKKGSALRSLADLAGRRGATVPGSSLEERMKGLGGVRYHFVERSGQNYEAVRDGAADFALVDSTSALTVLPSYPQLEVAFNLPGRESYGFAVAPGSDLRQALDRHLDQLRRGGVFFSLVRRIFGEKGLELFQLSEDAP